MITSVFDIDRTLLPGTTAERLFLRYLIQKRVIGMQAALDTLIFLIVRGRTRPFQAVRQHRPYLQGQMTAAMTHWGLRCFDEIIRTRLSAAGVEQLRWHARSGHKTVLLSGSLPYVVEPMAEWLRVDHVVCSRLEQRGDCLTGRIVGLHPYGGAKALLVQRLAHVTGIDLGQSYCYADHHSDADMLSLFGHPVCINPTDRLRMIANHSGWRIEKFG